MLLQGLVCTKAKLGNDITEYESLSNEALLKQLQLVPIHLELQIQRLRSFQVICKTPADHRQYLTIMFGKLLAKLHSINTFSYLLLSPFCIRSHHAQGDLSKPLPS